MKDEDNICLACGICCDGTLIGFVEVEAAEFSRLKGVLEIEESDEIGFFLHPCEKFCEKCTIYDQRPKQCGLFECKVLKSYEQGEMDFKTATNIIESVIEKKVAIQEKLVALDMKLKSGSFCFKMMEIKNLLAAGNTKMIRTNKHDDLMLDIEELNDVVMKHFGVSYF